jgi:sugar/nucleoside kinase (ribokinase family)
LFLQPALAAELPGLLAEARASGLSTSLDTNDDPARTWRGLAELLPYVDVLLPNRAEATGIAGAVCGGCYDEPAAAGSALAKFCGLVVVKDGDRGAFGCTATEVMHQPPIGCEVVDTTGAGDTFDAAFLDGWLRRLPVTECLRRAVLAGGYAVGGVGGTGRQPGQHDLNTERRTR